MQMFARKKGEVKEETVRDIIEKARDEVRIEKKWDPVKQLEQRYNQYHHIEVNNDDQEELPAVQTKKFCGQLDCCFLLLFASTVNRCCANFTT